MSETVVPIRERILEAAFNAFMRFGFSGASTSQIARLAHVSKRDLYAQFGSKQAMLADCVIERTERMRQPLNLPAPKDRANLNRTLVEFGTTVIRIVSRPEVLATYRLAILEAENAPEVARTLDRHGRQANTEALNRLFVAACEQGLLAGAEPADMATVFLSALMGEGILIRLLMRVATPPDDADARRRAETAARCVFQLFGKAGDGG